MRIGLSSVVAGSVLQVEPGERVHALAARPLDRVLHRRLEVVGEVEDDIRALEAAHVRAA